MVSKYRDILEPPISQRPPSPVQTIQTNGASLRPGSPSGKVYTIILLNNLFTLKLYKIWRNLIDKRKHMMPSKREINNSLILLYPGALFSL